MQIKPLFTLCLKRTEISKNGEKGRIKKKQKDSLEGNEEAKIKVLSPDSHKKNNEARMTASDLKLDPHT